MKRKLEPEDEGGEVSKSPKVAQEEEDEGPVVEVSKSPKVAQEEEDEGLVMEVAEESAVPVEIDYENASLTTLLENYGASLSTRDERIFEMLKLRKKEMECLALFGPKRVETASKVSNPLFAHSGKANSILMSLNPSRAFTTAMHYDVNMRNAPNPAGFYDLRFLLPVLCHTLDEKNVCDAIKIVQNGWIYLIMRGLSLKNAALRKASFLAYKRVLFNLQQPKCAKHMDVKIWLHFLLAVKRGIGQLGECKISNLLSTWLVAAWEVVRQPSNPMFNRLTKFLLAKPILEMSILPEFIPFFNASDGNKESREWVLNVLYWGLKTSEDWKIAQKLPTIKFLCSSFTLEKLKTRKNIVGILTRGAGIPEVAQIMVEKHSLPLWVSNIVTRDGNLQFRVAKLYESLKSNSVMNSSRTSLFEFVKLRIEINNAFAAAAGKHILEDADETAKDENSELKSNDPIQEVST
ncbi:unnamed protein product [Allacma fusca]|uniref:URB1 C-terminal domain-containing protein n=1 Tax=Allacma fusca TaxID=39272 RepID=A0A8J2NTA8_9HEXA|nr:unnamed protein product [Allacma fusca]